MPEVSPGVIWFVSAMLIWAAVVDGLKLKVPNWMTYPMIAAGLGYWTGAAGSAGFLASLNGAMVGLLLLLPLYAIGGMGAGDVKLLAGVGAWVGWKITMWSFVVFVFVGAAMAVVMAVWSGDVIKHWVQMQAIAREILTIRNPSKLAEIAAERKPRMKLLPYGIPIAVGTIAFFAWAGLFVRS
jgi:prepilin peptidase CpaA